MSCPAQPCNEPVDFLVLVTACDDYVSVNAQCAHALLDQCHRCFYALAYPRSSCHVNSTRHLLWSHGWWEMIPTDIKVYIKHEKSSFLTSDWDFTDIASVVSWFIGWVYVAANLVRFQVIPVDDFQISFLKVEFQIENFSLWQKNSENCKTGISHFQNFEKIDLTILANRSNRSNRKKSLDRLDRFIDQRINKISGQRWEGLTGYTHLFKRPFRTRTPFSWRTIQILRNSNPCNIPSIDPLTKKSI